MALIRLPVRIVLTHRARQESQRLGAEGFRSYERILRNMAQGRLDSRALAGHDGYFRARHDKVRVIWAWQPREAGVNVIRVVKVARRDKAYQQGLVDGWVVEEVVFGPVDATEDPPVDMTARAPGLAYRWDPERQADIRQFLRFDYIRSPELQPEQERVFLDWLPRCDKPLYLQSAPGTGKTTCAIHWAETAVEGLGWHVELVAPAGLLSDLRELPLVQALESRAGEGEGGTSGLRLMDWRTWLRETWGRAFPELELASREQEREALQRAVERARWSAQLKHGELAAPDDRDVVMFQGHVLDTVSRRDPSGLAVQAERLASLGKLREYWPRALDGRVCRHDAAGCLLETAASVPAPARPGAAYLLVVDEAQELLNVERLALEALFEAWRAAGHAVHLMLLGDLNQRLAPSGFTWPMGNPPGLLHNFRNSRRVAEVSRACYDLARAATRGARALPPSAHLHADCEEEGAVLYHVLKDDAAAADVPAWLGEAARRIDARRHVLIHNDRTRVAGPAEATYVRTLSYDAAKGREFNACIFLELFASGQSNAEQFFAWYTMLSRPRVAMLVVLTPAELAALDRMAADLEHPNPITFRGQSLPTLEDIERQFLRVFRNDVDLRAKGEELRAGVIALAQDGRLDEDEFRLAWDRRAWDAEGMRVLVDAWRGASPAHADALRRALAAVEPVDAPARVLRAACLEAIGASWEAFCELRALDDARTLAVTEGWFARLADQLAAAGLPLYAASIRRWSGEDVPAVTLPTFVAPGEDPVGAVLARLRRRSEATRV